MQGGKAPRAATAIALGLAVVLALGGGTTAAAAPRPDPSRPTPRAASRAAAPRLQRCGVPGARCGTVTVPLDRAHPGGPTLAIKFELHSHTDKTQPSLGTIVTVEGGPGYPSRGSRDGYLDLYAPLLGRRDLLIVDNRGTGESGLIDCEPLQSYVGTFEENAGLCAQQLGDAADDYGTGNAVEDMIAVLDSLGIGKIDLYGDSYGTFFSQTFAVRHPERIRSLVLDSSYPIEGSDPWYRDSARGMRKAWRLACARRPSCAAIGGDPISRMGAAANRLRATPLVGAAADADSAVRTVTLDAAGLAYMSWTAAGYPPLYRELDAAIRAYMRPTNPDQVPLLRLAAEYLPVGGAGDPIDFTEGLYAAVICHDYPQLWDPKAPQATKNAQYLTSVADLIANDPKAFAPFTITDWLTQPLAEWTYCLRWPAPSVDDPPMPAGTTYPTVPTLVLAGDLDSNTSLEGGKAVAKKFGAKLVQSVNLTHVSAIGDFGRCTSNIVVSFVDTLATGPKTCAKHYNETRLVDDFAVHTADVAGATADEKVARAVAETAADPLARWWAMVGTDGVGLRGGTFSYSGDPVVRFRLKDDRWVDDLPVTGTVTWHRDTGDITASLSARTPEGKQARLTLAWSDWAEQGTVAITGKVGPRPVAITVPAP